MFAINSNSGTLSFQSLRDFENPADADQNNVYLVTVRGADSASKAANEKLVSFVNKQVHVSGKITQRDQLRFLELTEVQLAD